ncbi:helix-hairpin-helix domain-containing protein [Pseudomonas sp. Z5-35]|uniref:ComEA family DNA-binding protein n=1 Tax=unclassified Pseudomonas TaxID=196821 RepID=UPI003DA8C870
MRTRYFCSLVFALLTGGSIAAVAAPTAKLETVASQQAIEVGASQRAKIDLNGADATTLQRELLGVGEAKAKAIVAYRESNGAFSSVEELLEVKGIGKAIVDKNRDKLEVK